MFYLALCFIAAGLIMMLYAFMHSNRALTGPAVRPHPHNDSMDASDEDVQFQNISVPEEKPVFQKSGEQVMEGAGQGTGPGAEQMEKIVTGEKLKPLDDYSYEDPSLIVEESDLEELFLNRNFVAEKIEDNEFKPGESSCIAIEGPWHAVLFRDTSGTVVYGEKKGINPEIDKYKQIKRVAEGKFSMDEGGISFTDQNDKLYRFDFNRFDSVVNDQAICACELSGVKGYVLFLFDEKEHADRAQDAFSGYSSNS